MFHAGDSNRPLLLATYAVRAPQGDVLAVARKFATGRTVGTWLPVPGLTPRTGRGTRGGWWTCSKCLREIGTASDERYVLITIAFPWENLGASSPSFSPRSSATTRRRRCKLSSFPWSCPATFAGQFPGPRFGIDGVHERLGILIVHLAQHDQTVPRFHAGGWSRTVLRDGPRRRRSHQRRRALRGPRPLSRLRAVRRLSAGSKKRVFEETGRKVGYLCNVSGPAKRTRDNALRAAEAGVTGLMVNFVFTGFDAVAELHADPDLDLPIFGHSAGAGALCEAAESGTDSFVLIGLLPRLAGIDIVLYNTPYGGTRIRGKVHTDGRKAEVGGFAREAVHAGRRQQHHAAAYPTPHA